MNKDIQNPLDFLPLSQPVFHILLALADEDRHGYGIIKEVEARTNGKLVLKPGTLYQAIHRLLQAGLLVEVTDKNKDEITDSRRRIYHLTQFGQQVIIAETERLEELVRQVQRKNILDEGDLKSDFRL